MPIPIAIAAAAMNAGSSILGNVLNASSNKKINRENQNFAREMYNRQREDALADYQMQNEYDSPKMQMARLRDAGLNPNLVYGHGADAQGGTVRSSSAPSYSGQPTNYDFRGLGESFLAYQDIKLREAQTDNLTRQNSVIAQDAILRAAQVQSTLADAHTKEFDLKMKNELKEISLEAANESLKKLKTDVDRNEIGLDLDQRTFDANIKKTEAEARKALGEAGASQHMEARVLEEIKNLKKDGDIKQFQINLNKLGLTSSDPVYMRILQTLFGKYIPKQ